MPDKVIIIFPSLLIRFWFPWWSKESNLTAHEWCGDHVVSLSIWSLAKIRWEKEAVTNMRLLICWDLCHHTGRKQVISNVLKFLHFVSVVQESMANFSHLRPKEKGLCYAIERPGSAFHQPVAYPHFYMPRYHWMWTEQIREAIK